MAGIHLAKITGGIETAAFEGLARLLAYGGNPYEAEGYELALNAVNQEPQFEHLTDTGLLVIKGIRTARITLDFDYERDNVPEIHSATMVAICSVSLDMGQRNLVDPNVSVRMNSGNSRGKATYYVMAATCSFVE